MYIDRYFGRYPAVAAFMAQAKRVSSNVVHTLYGRRIPISRTINAAAAQRVAINAPIQGSAADLMKQAMLAVDRFLVARRLRTRIVLQVHDELVLEAPHSEVEMVCEALPALMQVTPLAVPLEVSVGVGANWEEAHG